ncbi:MAG: sigma-E processing peptidase SpoIIGA [Clostridia bacterium]
MKVIVYVDILILLNFFINYILLKSTALLAKAVINVKRLMLSAGILSFGSLIIFLKPLNFLIMILIKIVFLFIMSFIAFGFNNSKRFFKLTFFLLLITFIFNGIISGIWYFASSENVYFNNQTVYFNINLYLLLALVVLHIF